MLRIRLPRVLTRFVPRFRLSLSVRARIAALAVIPIAAFAAIGVTYFSGDRAVEAAVTETRTSVKLTETSSALKSALVSMRESAKDFAATPLATYREAFEAAYADAEKRANEIEQQTQRADITERLTRIGNEIVAAKENFDRLVQAQEQLGFNIATGAQGELYSAANGILNMIEEFRGAMSADEPERLANALMAMRLQEKEFLLNRNRDAVNKLQTEHQKFTAIIDGMAVNDDVKDRFRQSGQAYRKAFDLLVNSAAPAKLYLNLIAQSMQGLAPVADEIFALAARDQAVATEELEASQDRIRGIIFTVGAAAVLAMLLVSWLIGRSITRPLNGLSGAMARLAEGDTAVAIPATESKDEIGAMARTVIVFRDNAVERERLAATQTETNRERERRAEAIAAMIARFEQSVDQALGKVRGAVDRLENAASTLNGAADLVSNEARDAESRVTTATENVTAAASSAEELAASIGHIAQQAAKSTEVADRAVSEANRTVTTMNQLASAASRIGEVIGLIQAIAGQTNLLALNATIEAARAGEAGRGFAVVASEVKSLAGQTAKATEEVATQIGAIQTAAAEAADAIEQVNSIINEMSQIAGSVAAAVEQQNIAVATIAEGVNRASSESRSGAEAMGRVAGASTEARGTATEVKSLAESLADEAESLDGEVRRFLTDVRAA